jgi:hypothetical protein
VLGMVSSPRVPRVSKSQLDVAAHVAGSGFSTTSLAHYVH